MSIGENRGVSGVDDRFDRYQEADVSQYGKTGTGPYDHLFVDF